MKKKILFALIVLIAAMLFYGIFVTRVFHKEINIPQPIALINKQVSTVDNISRWYLPFASGDSTNFRSAAGKIAYGDNSLSITKHVGLSIWYEVAENKKQQTVMFSVLADTGRSSKVILSYESTWWNKILGTNSIIKNAEESLKNLKEYFADTKKMYGYQMEVADVTDTAFVFTSKVVSKSIKKEAFKNLFESLINYATEKNLGYTGVRIFYTSPYGNDSIHLFTSIGITNTKDVPMDGVFSLKKMPYKGHLLTAYYQGNFDNVNNAINALGQFKSDNEMTSMAIPFIKLISEGIYFEDNQIIQAKACYPIQ
jgi:effector-binding domain-containing protein